MDEILDDLPDDQSQWTPIQWVEFREEVKRRVESGEIIVIHGKKSDWAKSQWHRSYSMVVIDMMRRLPE